MFSPLFRTCCKTVCCNWPFVVFASWQVSIYCCCIVLSTEGKVLLWQFYIIKTKHPNKQNKKATRKWSTSIFVDFSFSHWQALMRNNDGLTFKMTFCHTWYWGQCICITSLTERTSCGQTHLGRNMRDEEAAKSGGTEASAGVSSVIPPFLDRWQTKVTFKCVNKSTKV